MIKIIENVKGETYNRTITFLVSFLLLVLPSFRMDLYMGTESGKLLLFLYSVVILAGITCLYNVFIRNRKNIVITLLDISLFIWVVYIMFNSCIHGFVFSSRLYEFWGLIAFYIILRQLSKKDYVLLFIAIVLGGIIQSFYANMQLWGIIISNNALFKVTGSFFNPGPLGGYLVGAFSILLGGYFYYTELSIDKDKNSWVKCVFIILGFFLLLGIAASQSRAAWLSALTGLILLGIVRYGIVQKLQQMKRLKMFLVLLSVMTFISLIVIGSVSLRPASANGRMFIWKVTSGMIQENLINGIGFDRFKSHYMLEQASFFSKYPCSLEADFAGNTVFCFNEFLQHFAENGLIGIALLLGVLICICLIHSHGAAIPKISLISIGIFSLFSYTSYILALKIMITVNLAFLSVLMQNNKCSYKLLMQKGVTFVFGLIIVGLILWSMLFIYSYHRAWRNWTVANEAYQMYDYKKSVKYYGLIWSEFKCNGDYLTQYGKALEMASYTRSAIDVSLRAKRYFPNVITYISLGNCYKSIEKFQDAEKAYLTAWYMNPSKFYPKYLLAKMYDEIGEKTKARIIASELLRKKVKIHSETIDDIKDEMKNILD